MLPKLELRQLLVLQGLGLMLLLELVQLPLLLHHQKDEQ
jgi:hypothetical protein